MAFTELASKLQALALQMNVALVKAGGSADGSLQIISMGDAAGQSVESDLQLALPVRGSPSRSGRYRTRSTASFKCAYLVQEQEDGEEMVAAWLRFAEQVQAEGYELTGERRVVLTGDGGQVRSELQLGIK